MFLVARVVSYIAEGRWPNLKTKTLRLGYVGGRTECLRLGYGCRCGWNAGPLSNGSRSPIGQATDFSVAGFSAAGTNFSDTQPHRPPPPRLGEGCFNSLL